MPVNAPPMVLDVDAVQEVALVDVHANCTAPPKLTLVALAGEVNVTVGIVVDICIDVGVGVGVGEDIDIDEVRSLRPPPPHATRTTAAIPGTHR